MLVSAWGRGRNCGKYSMIKQEMANWCANAKVGDKMILASPQGDFVLKYDGIFKPDNNAFISFEDSPQENPDAQAIHALLTTPRKDKP